ncbi:MAG: peptidyl-prolyl cis-trans isomerase, partial [Gemmatimonadetes bacterium]|nr:peptidyl-prolyl cis-trans isomerase [Gemmatimonadota bacterium]
PEIMSAEQFQTDGQFDLAKYRRYLTSGTDPQLLAALEARYRQEIPRAKLFDQLVADVYLSDVKLWQAYRDQHDSVTLRLLQVFPDLAVADSEVLVSDAEIETYYDRHREEFERRAVAYLSYVEVSREANAADSAAALARARAVRQELASGADFAAVASRESSDTVSAAQGGDLGETTRGRFVPEFERAALALRPGELSQPVRSPFGYHLIKLESKSGDTYRARHILIGITPAGAHLDSLDAQIDTLDRRAADQLDDPTALDSAAAVLGLPIKVALPVVEGSRVQALPHVVPDAGIWAFEAEVGETSPLIDADRASFVFRLDSLTPGGVPPLPEIREMVRRRILTEKKREAVRQLAERSAADLASGAVSLDQLAARFRATVTTVGPFTRANPGPAVQNEPVIVGAAFGLAVGEIGGPLSGEEGVYFMQPALRRQADSTAFVAQLATQRAQALQVARQARVRLVLGSLRAAADVQDRRKDLERAQREAEERAQSLPGVPANQRRAS